MAFMINVYNAFEDPVRFLRNISEEKEEAQRLIGGNRFLKGFDHLKIKSVILSAVELLKSEKDDREFLSLVREGIVLWDKTEDEAGIKAIVR